jgi:hypothetical protein
MKESQGKMPESLALPHNTPTKHFIAITVLPLLLLDVRDVQISHNSN